MQFFKSFSSTVTEICIFVLSKLLNFRLFLFKISMTLPCVSKSISFPTIDTTFPFDVTPVTLGSLQCLLHKLDTTVPIKSRYT